MFLTNYKNYCECKHNTKSKSLSLFLLSLSICGGAFALSSCHAYSLKVFFYLNYNIITKFSHLFFIIFVSCSVCSTPKTNLADD